MPKLKEMADLTHQHGGIFLIDTVTGLGGTSYYSLLSIFGINQYHYRSIFAYIIIIIGITITGIEVKIDEWGIDGAFSGTQKCIGVTPSLSPLTIGPR